MRNHSSHGEYRVFEMTKRCSSDDAQSSSLDSQSDGSITPKSRSRNGFMNRLSMILATFSLVISIAFLIIALTYSHQVKAELETVSLRIKKENHVNTNNSINLAQTVANLKRVEIDLKAEINSLKDANATHYSNIAMQLQQLYKTDMNQSEKFMTLEEWKRNDSYHTAALLVETAERIRQDAMLIKQLQQLDKSWNSSQSSILAQLANLQAQNDVNETIDQSFQSVRTDFAKLTRVVNLVANHWKGDPTKLMYRRFDQLVTYQTAVTRCKSAGGNIAAKVFRDVDLVRDMITYGYLRKGSWIWIGYHAKVGERIWRWTDGGETDARTTRWNAGEPNDYGDIEDCAEANVIGAHSIGMNDLACSLNRGYLCEMIMT